MKEYLDNIVAKDKEIAELKEEVSDGPNMLTVKKDLALKVKHLP